MIAGIAVGVLLVLGAVGFLTFRSKNSPATGHADSNSSVRAAMPPLYSDANGQMVLVPSGPFIFGPKSEAKTVDLPAFYIDETEVSNAQYKRFCQATGHPIPQTPDFATHPDYPVSGVNYHDAEAYAAWAGKRLPTEEEWEKAARGTDNRTFPWGDNPWVADIPKKIQPVNSDPAHRSPFGVYNMAGNVWEWTASSYTPQPAELDRMKQMLGGTNFSSSWQITKGGSFSPGNSEYFAISKRRGLPDDALSPWIGFRCVRNANPPA